MRSCFSSRVYWLMRPVAGVVFLCLVLELSETFAWNRELTELLPSKTPPTPMNFMADPMNSTSI